MRARLQSLNWRHALGELTLIIVGILIALAIDACAAERAARNDAEAYLRDLARELRADSVDFTERIALLSLVTESATSVLAVIETGDTLDLRVADALLSSGFGGGRTSEPVVWEELRATGNLRLISDAAIRNAIVSHYLFRAERMTGIEENLGPAVVDLRALVLDLLPVDGFARFFQGGTSDVPDAFALNALRERDDAEFLLKRTIVASLSARAALRAVLEDGGELLARLARRTGS